MQQRFERLLEREVGERSPKPGTSADRRPGPARKDAKPAQPERQAEEKPEEQPAEGKPLPMASAAATWVRRDLAELEHAPGQWAEGSITVPSSAQRIASHDILPGGPAGQPAMLAQLAAAIEPGLAAGRAADGAFQLELAGPGGMIAARVERGAGAALAITLQLPGADEAFKRRLMRDLARHLAERGGHECTLQLADLVQRS